MRRTILVLAVLGACAFPATASGASGADYLASRLQPGGGFAESGARFGSVALTSWAVMGLTAAGRNPATMHRAGGRTPVYFLARHVREYDDAYTLSRAILAVVAMGKTPYSFGGRNLVAALRTKISPNGHIGLYLNSTYWGVLALRAANSPVPTASLNLIRGAQLSNGGYSWQGGAAPDSNDTAAAVMALRSSGIPCSWNAVARAYSYMHTLQRSDHGYALTATGASDSQSTAWVIQARRKCGLPNSGALSYLFARQLPSGAFNYQPGRTVTPAWVTSQVLPATNGRSYPVRP
jgi:hypothetical protein